MADWPLTPIVLRKPRLEIAGELLEVMLLNYMGGPTQAYNDQSGEDDGSQ